MKVVRQRMIRPFSLSNNLVVLTTMLLFLFSLSACNPTEITSSGNTAFAVYDGSMVNKAYIYRDSPYYLEGPNYGPVVDIKRMIDSSMPEIITTNNQLTSNCTFKNILIPHCVHSYSSQSPTQQLLNRKSDGSWNFPPGSAEFYQVNTLWHIRKSTEKFFNHLQFGYDFLWNNFLTLSLQKRKSIPEYLTTSKMFWFQALSPLNDNFFRNSFLSSYSSCNFESNAFFSPALPELCFGIWSKVPSFMIVQDPTIVSHELGHAFVAIMMNLRNGTNPLDLNDFRTNLISLGFNEAAALNEGIADFWSYVTTQKTHFGAWGLKFTQNSRPITENDPSHISAVRPTPEGRLSYPHYLFYDSNEPEKPFEGIHQSGQIASHYFMALSEELKDKCVFETEDKHEEASKRVIFLIAETLSELGDLRSIGADKNNGDALLDTSGYRFNNLDPKSSFLWAQVVNQVTYRRFFQTFAKYIYRYMPLMGCSDFDKDASEILLDDYGLLLFKTYNDNDNSTVDENVYLKANSTGTVCNVSSIPCLSNTPNFLTSVNEANRRKTVLISKQLLSIAPRDEQRGLRPNIINDQRASIEKYLSSLLFKGYVMNLSQGLAGVEYNNNNANPSPGEVIAYTPDLYNSSNSPMAGVLLLANDWDHVQITDPTGLNGNFKPCVFSNDTLTQDEGGHVGDTCNSTLNTYRRHVKGSSGLFCNSSTGCNEAVAPVCLVQYDDGNSTKWISQNEFRKKQGLALQDKDCLGHTASSTLVEDFTFNPHECLVRVLPGANHAYFSRIDAQKSFKETMYSQNKDYIFKPSSFILFELNKWIPPGTKFRCRLRARFSNCTDCFENPAFSNDDYIDKELNGNKPFKIINLDFEVND
jgi:hypothetical protein